MASVSTMAGPVMILGSGQRCQQGSSVMSNKAWAINTVGSSVSFGGGPVILVDKSEVSRDGLYPFSEEQLMRNYYWKFDNWYPRCCMACSVNGLFPIHEYKWHSHSAALAVPEEITSSCEEMDLSRAAQASTNCDLDQPGINDLPDHVLVNIFGYVHTVELMHSIPMVSRRWKRLSQTPKLWHEVRIVICEEALCRNSLRTFLHRLGRYIRKICIYVLCGEPLTDAEFMELFPQCMPSVTMLDIGFFWHLTVPMARFFISCFPNVQLLNVEGLKKVEAGAFTVILSEGFPYLRELILSHCESLTVEEYDTLCSTSRALEVLSVDGIMTLQSYSAVRLAKSTITASLTRLYLDGEEMYDGAFCALTCCRNLKLLSVSYCESATNLSLGYIKTLSKLEHLHLRKGKEFTSEALVKFFQIEPAKKDSSIGFPATLKYLNLGECPGVNDAVVELLTTACPDLLSLCLVWCWSVTDVGFAKIIERLKRLKLLDIRGMDCIDGKALLEVPKLYCKELRYLGAEQCPRIEDVTLQMLNLQKKDLIISNYHNYFITFYLEGRQAAFGERFDRHFQQVVFDELSRFDGFCCMSDLR